MHANTKLAQKNTNSHHCLGFLLRCNIYYPTTHCIIVYYFSVLFPKQYLHYGVLNCVLGLVVHVSKISRIAGIPVWDPNT